MARSLTNYVAAKSYHYARSIYVFPRHLLLW